MIIQKGREGKGREGKRGEGKGREGKGREGKGIQNGCCSPDGIGCYLSVEP